MDNPNPAYRPVLELTRGGIVESVHFGAFSIVTAQGQLVAAHGDPQLVTFLRSSAKPFQALPFIEKGGADYWDFSPKQIAVMCASHSGTDDHFETISQMQAKIEVGQDDLLCGTHLPGDQETAWRLIRNQEQPTSNRHNCSGKHTGMLASARMQQLAIGNYLDTDHPVQRQILQAFSEMCSIAPEQVVLGIDGCSAPVFAVPLYHAALGFARLCDPGELAPERAAACQKITRAMQSHPEMIAGPGKFDTRLMQVAGDKLVSKGGAEGYQAVGLRPGAVGLGSPALGITLKISDGDLRGRARPAIILEILRQLGALTASELEALSEFGPQLDLTNYRQIHIGEARPCFQLVHESLTRQ